MRKSIRRADIHGVLINHVIRLSLYSFKKSIKTLFNNISIKTLNYILTKY